MNKSMQFSVPVVIIKLTDAPLSHCDIYTSSCVIFAGYRDVRDTDFLSHSCRVMVMLVNRKSSNFTSMIHKLLLLRNPFDHDESDYDQSIRAFYFDTY